MPTFRYQALNTDAQPVSGEIEASSVAAAVAELENTGLNVQAISLATSEPAVSAPSASATADRSAVAIENHLRAAIERGRVIAPALRAYADEMPSGRWRHELTAMVRVLEQGNIEAALAALPRLPAAWIPLLSSGTRSLDPGRMLQDFLKEARRADELRRQWWLAILYPLLVAILAITVISALSVFVIPIFRDIFLGFGLRLPGLTNLVLGVAQWIASGRVLLDVALFGIVVFLLCLASRLIPAGVRAWVNDRLSLLLGRSSTLARFSQSLADLLDAGLDRVSALRLAARVTPSSSLRRAATRLADDWESGSPFASTRHTRFLTATVWHALQADLSPAARVRLLSEASACHAERARNRSSWTRGIIEPVALGLIGILVGATVLALFLPLFMLIQGLAG